VENPSAIRDNGRWEKTIGIVPFVTRRWWYNPHNLATIHLEGETMKTRTLAALAMLVCSILLAPSLLRAEENEWYQGQQGQWQQHGKQWRWESTHGDDWYQGHQGHWYQERDGWRYLSNDGAEYRKGRSGWAWAYHNRNPKTDRRSFEQLKDQH
jgi:hypothetical protein